MGGYNPNKIDCLFLEYIINTTTTTTSNMTTTKMIQNERTLRLTLEIVINRMTKAFKLTNEKHFNTASYIYFECRGVYHYVLNDETKYTIFRTNHKLKKIVFESTNESDCSNIRGFHMEKPKNFVNETATLVKETNVFIYENKQYKPRTEQQKAETAQNKLNKINFLKEQKLITYKIDSYERFCSNLYAKSTKFTRVMDLQVGNYCIIGQYKLPYGFTYSNGILSSSSIYVKDDIEFNKIIDDAIVLRDTQILTMDDSTIFCMTNGYYHKTCQIHCEKMTNLHRDSITQAYNNSITNMLVKNTHINSNCVGAIMEFL